MAYWNKVLKIKSNNMLCNMFIIIYMSFLLTQYQSDNLLK